DKDTTTILIDLLNFISREITYENALTYLYWYATIDQIIDVIKKESKRGVDIDSRFNRLIKLIGQKATVEQIIEVFPDLDDSYIFMANHAINEERKDLIKKVCIEGTTEQIIRLKGKIINTYYEELFDLAIAIKQRK
ncbi:MAG: hypothetical protein WC356_07400, partial [Candidatus Micrarchaeia archaeon]